MVLFRYHVSSSFLQRRFEIQILARTGEIMGRCYSIHMNHGHQTTDFSVLGLVGLALSFFAIP